MGILLVLLMEPTKGDATVNHGRFPGRKLALVKRLGAYGQERVVEEVLVGCCVSVRGRINTKT